MAKQFLDDLDAFALLTQEARQRMPKRVPADDFRNPRLDGCRANVILKRWIAAKVFEEIILSVVKEFHLTLAVESIEKKLDLAKYAPLLVVEDKQ